MSFAQRAARSEQVAELINRELFARPPFAVQHFGVERHLAPEFIRALYECMDDTANFARYAPDSLVVHRPTRRAFFVEYKVMQKPATPGMIRERATNRYAQLDEAEWTRAKRGLTPETWGIIEREALDNYLLLAASHVRVCLVVAASYHPELLLAEWTERLLVVYRQQDRVKAEPGRRANPYAAGSGTPYVNIHLGRMRTLERFLTEEFEVALPKQMAMIREQVAQAIGKR